MTSGLRGRGVSTSIEPVSPAIAAVLAREHPIYADHPQTTLAQLADMITRHARDRRLPSASYEQNGPKHL